MDRGDRTERGRRAVLVDMDDTIFDHSLTCRDAIAALRPTYPFLAARPLDDLWGAYLHLLDVVTPNLGSPGLTADQARTERWRRIALSCGTALSPGEARELSGRYREIYQRLRRAVPGALGLLAQLHRRAPVVVVTNNEVAEQEEKARFLGLGPLIDGLVVSEAVGAAKPDRRIFEVALATAGVRAEEAAMVGDSWTSDVLGAEGAGIRAVWFNRFGLSRPDGRAVDELRSLEPAEPAVELLLAGARSSSRMTRRPEASEL